jgi:hypothetical protein
MRHHQSIKNYPKILLRRCYLKWQFKNFVKKIHSQTWLRHDELLLWAEQCINQTDKLEDPKLYEESEDPIVRQGYVLVKEIRQKFLGKYRNYKKLRILVHLPPSKSSPGGYSLFGNLIQALDFIGIPVKALEWNAPIENHLNVFKPSVFITGDNSPFLTRINWDAVAKYRKNNGLKLGLTASLEEYGNTPLAERLKWAKEHQVDFYYSFRAPEYLTERKEYQPFYDNGYQIFSVEFGANPLLHYPVPKIKRDLNYVFLASVNPDKWPRYFAFLTKLLSNYSGLIDGPNWPNLSRRASLPVHRFLYDRFLYARAKVGLNLHIRDSIDWASELNERTYILAACGVPQLVDNAKLLTERFSNDCFFVAKTPKEYEQLFIYLLTDPEEAQERALKAQQEVFARHTGFHRAEGLISALGKII